MKRSVFLTFLGTTFLAAISFLAVFTAYTIEKNTVKKRPYPATDGLLKISVGTPLGIVAQPEVGSSDVIVLSLTTEDVIMVAENENVYYDLNQSVASVGTTCVQYPADPLVVFNQNDSTLTDSTKSIIDPITWKGIPINICNMLVPGLHVLVPPPTYRADWGTTPLPGCDASVPGRIGVFCYIDYGDFYTILDVCLTWSLVRSAEIVCPGTPCFDLADNALVGNPVNISSQLLVASSVTNGTRGLSLVPLVIDLELNASLIVLPNLTAYNIATPNTTSWDIVVCCKTLNVIHDLTPPITRFTCASRGRPTI